MSTYLGLRRILKHLAAILGSSGGRLGPILAAFGAILGSAGGLLEASCGGPGLQKAGQPSENTCFCVCRRASGQDTYLKAFGAILCPPSAQLRAILGPGAPRVTGTARNVTGTAKYRTETAQQCYSKRIQGTILSHPIYSRRQSCHHAFRSIARQVRGSFLAKTRKNKRKTSVFAHVDVLWTKMGILRHLAAILGHLGVVWGPS